GGNAQIKAMKQVAGSLKLDLAQFQELETFAQFATELDTATQAQITRGQRLMELMKQPQYSPMEVEDQVAVLFAGINGYLDDLPISAVRAFEEGLLKFIKERYVNILNEIRTTKQLSKENESKLHEAIKEFKEEFVKLYGK
ncbi:MAG TPA: F0F1 ATP synthase subunit alpha, partial [Fervidobacterium nodosum]|nr:F0F1 ATP synthase subunit alpha [Fervidobacterium nodosum]